MKLKEVAYLRIEASNVNIVRKYHGISFSRKTAPAVLKRLVFYFAPLLLFLNIRNSIVREKTKTIILVPIIVILWIRMP